MDNILESMRNNPKSVINKGESLQTIPGIDQLTTILEEVRKLHLRGIAKGVFFQHFQML